MSLTLKDHNEREREVLKTIPKDELWDFIERKGWELRTIIDEHEEWNSQQIIDALILGYKGL